MFGAGKIAANTYVDGTAQVFRDSSSIPRVDKQFAS
jgi:hypothetical protein